MKENSSYFSHDSDSTDDPKIMMLISKWGLEAYGIFWTIIEHLRKQPNYKSHLAILKALAARYSSTEEKFRYVVMDFGLFCIDNDEFFYSQSLIDRMKPLQDKREKMRQLALKRWRKDDVKDMRTHMPTQSKGNASKVKESKVKYIYNKYYDSELENSKNDIYKQFVEYLFNTNPNEKPLNKVLSLKDQLSEKRFMQLYKIYGSDKMKDKILGIQASKKDYNSFNLTLTNWLKR